MQIKKKLLKNIIIQNVLAFFVSIYIYIVRFTSSIQYENQSIPEKFWNNDQVIYFGFLAQSANDDKIFMENK